jgi:hypothetical protein
MDLAPNSTKSMEYLKGYSAKAGFVLTRGVGWKLPTFATHYTTYRFVLFFLIHPVAQRPSSSCRVTHLHPRDGPLAVPLLERPAGRLPEREEVGARWLSWLWSVPGTVVKLAVAAGGVGDGFLRPLLSAPKLRISPDSSLKNGRAAAMEGLDAKSEKFSSWRKGPYRAWLC